MTFEDSKESTSSLLGDVSDEKCSDELSEDLSWRPQSKLKRPLLLHGLFILVHLCILFLQIFLSSSTARHSPENFLIHSPANEAISYVETQYHIEPKINSPYVGDPRPELDTAWNELLANTNIRLSESDMAALDRTNQGIALPDGGYLGILNVYHELHCIKRLHQALHPAHYFPDLTPKQRAMNLKHSDHCLDTLRQGIMCHGDTSLLTLKWAPWTKIPLANFSATHQCVDWERLDGWATEHSVPRIYEKDYIVHPTLGPSFPDKGDGNGTETAHLGVVVDEA